MYYDKIIAMYLPHKRLRDENEGLPILVDNERLHLCHHKKDTPSMLGQPGDMRQERERADIMHGIE